MASLQLLLWRQSKIKVPGTVKAPGLELGYLTSTLWQKHVCPIPKGSKLKDKAGDTWHIFNTVNKSYCKTNVYWAKSGPFLSFIVFPSHRTSTSCMACTWTPQHLPCSMRAESKASIRMILRRPGVSFRSTLSRSTWALSTLSQMTVEMSAGMTSKATGAHAPLCDYQPNRKRKGTEQNKMGHLVNTLGTVSRETSEPHSAKMI